MSVRVYYYKALMIMFNFTYWQELFNCYTLFTEPKEPKDIIGKIYSLFTNIELRVKLGNTGRELVEKEYLWEIEREKLLSIYKRIIVNN